jgi:hypothetical protein
MRRSCPIRPCVTMRASDGPWKPPWVASRQGSSRMTIPRARSLAWCSSRAESLHGLNDRIRAWEAQEEGRRPKIRGFKHQRTILATEVERLLDDAPFPSLDVRAGSRYPRPRSRCLDAKGP